MRIKIIDEICDYIRYIDDTYGVEITIHPLEQTNVWDDYLWHTRLAEMSFHQNLFCQQVKVAGRESNNMCVYEQYKCFEKCNVKDSFYYTCFAGVTQLIYPMFCSKKLIGYIAVGNFYEDKDKSYRMLNLFCKERKYNFENIKAFFDMYITPIKHQKSLFDVIIPPICSMIEIAYLQSENISVYDDDNSFYMRLLSYIKTNYTQKISVETLSKFSNCSVSFLSHFFKKQSGMSIPEYINFLRIRDAKVYLTMTNMNIQEIAYSLGYSSSNYFSTVFKNSVGCSPKTYRENLETQ